MKRITNPPFSDSNTKNFTPLHAPLNLIYFRKLVEDVTLRVCKISEKYLPNKKYQLILYKFFTNTQNSNSNTTKKDHQNLVTASMLRQFVCFVVKVIVILLNVGSRLVYIDRIGCGKWQVSRGIGITFIVGFGQQVVVGHYI